MDNMEIYEKVRKVPAEALKQIGGGRLKGMSDINPMWRIKTLTDLFGVCGIGWKTEVTKQWIEECGEETAAFCNILLYVKVNGEWSDGILGTGGAMLAAKEKNGIFVSDECFKMAYTDAISVACKALGIGADVYWDKDKTKYTSSNNNAPEPKTPEQNEPESKYPICKTCGKAVKPVKKSDGTVTPAEQVFLSCGNQCVECYQRQKAAAK